MGATKTLERVSVSLGMLDAPAPAFEASLDVSYAGVLLALPALLVCGLLHHTEKHFQLPRGYSRLESIFLLLAFMALSRIKAVEDLRYAAPGEWGKALGLDQIPEAKTLREKIKSLSNAEQPSQWAAALSAQWMQQEPEAAFFTLMAMSACTAVVRRLFPNTMFHDRNSPGGLRKTSSNTCVITSTWTD